ncbi:hypothetical protein Pmani_011464 [Petrolisthes manimaculis]|uniref:Uncharacterized protein n=1 Tax=Petrolisthes manimaculis TaxID=1843537 RepID=A0AAE1UBJ1_9EUCA|nr:hypothetical protein Pmani_011464 [Petrolisthes manimaculis]
MLPTSVTSAFYLLFTIIPAISVVCGWSWETGCGKWTEHLHYYVCDPDHTLQDFDRQLVNDTAAHCHVGARIENLRVVVFIKASLPAFTDTAEEDTTNTNNVGVMRDNGTLYMLDTGDERGKDGKQKTVTSVLHLEQQILRAYNNNNNNNTSPEQHSPTLFIIVTQKPFQVRVWASADVDLSESEMRGAEEVAHASHAAHHHLHTALTLALVSVCQSIKEKGMNNYTVHWVAFTVTWIFISVFFIGGLVCVALYLRQAKKTRIRESQTYPEGEVVGLHQRASCSRYASTSPPPASGDLNSNSAVAYRSTGHVLLGATDITALPSNRCSSTDHLLDS